MRGVRLGCFTVVLLSLPARAASPEAARSPVVTALQESVARSMKLLAERGSPPPYFLSYLVTDADERQLSATLGAVRRNSQSRRRVADIDVRVGSYDLDSTRRLRGSRASGPDRTRSVSLPLEDDVDALEAGLWLETDRQYRAAAERLPQVKADVAVKTAAEDSSADLSRESPETIVLPLPAAPPDLGPYAARLRSLSRLFDDQPEILEAEVLLTVSSTKKWFASSEGALLQHGSSAWRISLYATARADDGMDLHLFESFSARSAAGLPTDETIRAAAAKMKKTLVALRAAPVLEPFTGPAILSGKAAGVFFHEIFGHRIEGHRQKDERESQTFTKMVGEKVLPEFLSVYDDPTLASIAGVDLNGTFAADDEGIRAARVTVVENGVLRNFLMSRSPVAGFARSNGHGRAQPGMRPVGRQGNLIIEASKTVPPARLRDLLIEECRRQGKPFGLIFDDISGGFTFTGRSIPQSYMVMPLVVTRVWADGRPDELVRGTDLIGTPLISFSKILAAGDDRTVFNGQCGAESGFVPVAASAPSILTAQIEVQKRQKGSSRSPILPPPGNEVRK
jgi:predicted Zn-dependent protease